MRPTSSFRLAFALALLIAANPVHAASAPPEKTEHPGEVALIQEGSNWTYKHFPTNLTLYVYDHDTPTKSACVNECSFVWPPVIAHEEAKPLGDWTLVARDDGRKQWAYKGHPIYVRYHDSVEQPSGNGIDGLWHTLEP